MLSENLGNHGPRVAREGVIFLQMFCRRDSSRNQIADSLSRSVRGRGSALLGDRWRPAEIPSDERNRASATSNRYSGTAGSAMSTCILRAPPSTSTEPLSPQAKEVSRSITARQPSPCSSSRQVRTSSDRTTEPCTAWPSRLSSSCSFWVRDSSIILRLHNRRSEPALPILPHCLRSRPMLGSGGDLGRHAPRTVDS